MLEKTISGKKLGRILSLKYFSLRGETRKSYTLIIMLFSYLFQLIISINTNYNYVNFVRHNLKISKHGVFIFVDL